MNVDQQEAEDSRVRRRVNPAEMVAMRKQGKTFREIGHEAGVTAARVGQIVRKILPEEEDPMRVKPTNKRFIGAYLRPAVHDTLKHYLTLHPGSISEFVAGAVEAKLAGLGAKIEERPPYTGEPLPFAEEK